MVSLCLTTYNDRLYCGDWYRAYLAQTRKADEVIIVDGGSTDGSRDLLVYMGRLINAPTCNIQWHPSPVAHGRNIAAKHASGDILVFTDMGSLPTPQWLETLVRTMESGADVVYGLSSVRISKHLSKQISKLLPTYAGSARSLAVRREAWKRIGGFPEVSLCAEDTLFNERVKQLGLKVEICPALVEWLPPAFPHTFIRQQRRYAKGDGISRLRWRWYAMILIKHLLFPLYWPWLMYQYHGAFWLKLRLDLARVSGFLHGLANKDAQKHDTRITGT